MNSQFSLWLFPCGDVPKNKNTVKYSRKFQRQFNLQLPSPNLILVSKSMTSWCIYAH